MSWLKTYMSFDVLHVIWDVSYTNYNTKVWEYIDVLCSYFDEINIKDRLKYPPLQCGTDYIYTILDATECYIEKPLDNDERQRIYSGYKKRTTLKYSVASVLKEPLIIHVTSIRSI